MFFFKNRHCITVTNPDYKRNEMNPDIAKYAVFSDGLVVSSNNGEIIKELKNIFPDKELYFMSVSDLCIKQIYNKLIERMLEER